MEENIILPEARNTSQPLQGWIPQLFMGLFFQKDKLTNKNNLEWIL